MRTDRALRSDTAPIENQGELPPPAQGARAVRRGGVGGCAHLMEQGVKNLLNQSAHCAQCLTPLITQFAAPATFLHHCSVFFPTPFCTAHHHGENVRADVD